MLVYIALSNPDYYEDVLVATETAYEKKRSIAEGNIDAAQTQGKTVKITKTGIPGNGASALFGKHMRESFRQNRFGFLGFYSAAIIIGAILFSIFVEELFAVLSGLFWMQIFFIGTGRGLKETYTHYVYLIPESSFKKILWSNMEIMARVVTESVLIFGISGALLNEPLVNVLLYTVVYVLFSFLLLGINFLSMRFLGADLSAGLLIMIYFGAVVLIMLPGAIPAAIVGMAVGGNAGLVAGLLVLSGWELAAGLICFALARGVLHNSDMATVKTGR
jgi:MFS family permease